MKRWAAIGVTAFVVMVLLAMPVLAAGPGPSRRDPQQCVSAGHFALVGEIMMYDAAANRLTVRALRGNWLVTEYITSGDPLELALDPEGTWVRQQDALPGMTIPPGEWETEFSAGRLVSVGGKVVGGEFTAVRITLDPDLISEG